MRRAKDAGEPGVPKSGRGGKPHVGTVPHTLRVYT